MPIAVRCSAWCWQQRSQSRCVRACPAAAAPAPAGGCRRTVRGLSPTFLEGCWAGESAIALRFG
eukprot:5733161-Heterocapsa_arctica.AAC.1